MSANYAMSFIKPTKYDNVSIYFELYHKYYTPGNKIRRN